MPWRARASTGASEAVAEVAVGVGAVVGQKEVQAGVRLAVRGPEVIADGVSAGATGHPLRQARAMFRAAHHARVLAQNHPTGHAAAVYHKIAWT